MPHIIDHGHEDWARGHALLAFAETLAATQDLGTCPAWCIGTDHPEHDAWFADPGGDEEYSRCHVGVLTTDPVQVCVEQFEVRHNGEDTSEPAVIKCLAGADDGSDRCGGAPDCRRVAQRCGQARRDHEHPVKARSELRDDGTLIEPLLGAHLVDLALANQRPTSIRERRLTVMRAARAFGHPVAVVSADELAVWQRTTLASLSPASMHNATVHVRQYLRWLAKKGHRAEDPSAVLIRPKLRARLPRPLADADIAHAMTCAEQPMRAWIALGAFCGLRCMEIASLAREAVVDGVAVPFLLIEGKGGKERVVPLPVSVLAELRDAGMPKRGYLFARMDGNPGPPSAVRVSERICEHLHSLGIVETGHALRHRFGTKLYEATKDLMLVATVMGHESTETTMGYVKMNPYAAAASVELISTLGAAAVEAAANALG
jgi:integrase